MMKQLEKTPEEIYEKTGKPNKIVKKQKKENILQKMEKYLKLKKKNQVKK